MMMKSQMVSVNQDNQYQYKTLKGQKDVGGDARCGWHVPVSSVIWFIARLARVQSDQTESLKVDQGVIGEHQH